MVTPTHSLRDVAAMGVQINALLTTISTSNKHSKNSRRVSKKRK